uniref:Uncharacterized protein n=1 Tax=Rhizophora mucronata TaxID=61149 RepID=A0A2P2KXR6_RHIMU
MHVKQSRTPMKLQNTCQRAEN